MFSKSWSCFKETRDPDKLNTIEMNHVFTNRSKEDENFPLTMKEIVEAQKADPILKHLFKSNAVLSNVVPGHEDLDILLVILYKRVKVPSVRSILYSTTR